MSVDFYFLNVGYGDCTIVHWPERKAGDKTKDERIMMMDLYHHEDDEYEDVLEYYKTHFRAPDGSVKPIFRFVCSHPHQDHICGLKKLFADSEIRILNFWDNDHLFVPADFDGHETHEDDWKTYKLLGGTESPATVIKTGRSEEPRQFWDSDGDRVTILSPSDALIRYAHEKEDGTERDSDQVEIDEMSYALSVQVNTRSVILAGDGRATPAWNDIIDECRADLGSCAVLKAGHHGHDCSFHEEALKEMTPEIIIFSNSKSEDESNGAESDYKRLCPKAKIYKTFDGTIIVRVPFKAEEAISVEVL
jgi:metal-dependent hydrolase (beta-lactamase superfamily II)